MCSGGAYQIADTMYQYLNSAANNTFEFNKRITAVSSVTDGRGRTMGVNVTSNYTNTEQFSHVISTIPLPVLRTLDLSDADLSPLQSTALRELDYGPAVKSGMQFQTAWWTTGVDRNNNTLGIVGGQTYSDTPLHTVVYPLDDHRIARVVMLPFAVKNLHIHIVLVGKNVRCPRCRLTCNQ